MLYVIYRKSEGDLPDSWFIVPQQVSLTDHLNSRYALWSRAVAAVCRQHTTNMYRYFTQTVWRNTSSIAIMVTNCVCEEGMPWDGWSVSISWMKLWVTMRRCQAFFCIMLLLSYWRFDSYRSVLCEVSSNNPGPVYWATCSLTICARSAAIRICQTHFLRLRISLFEIRLFIIVFGKSGFPYPILARVTVRVTCWWIPPISSSTLRYEPLTHSLYARRHAVSCGTYCRNKRQHSEASLNPTDKKIQNSCCNAAYLVLENKTHISEQTQKHIVLILTKSWDQITSGGEFASIPTIL